MKHLGDVKSIDGRRCRPVDVITGGSPCQDLSIAGTRRGLAGERSGLFREQMRIVREMREESGGRYPRFMVWENVTGALSSNRGADFEEVLNACVQVCEKSAPAVSMPKDGKWPESGVFYDGLGRWSLAWRVHDAQFWGVAQRRRRVALVCDFGGVSAPEVLFEPDGVQRNFDQGNPQREKTTGNSFGSSESSDRVWDARGNGNGQLCATITGGHDNSITDYTNVVVQKTGVCAVNGDIHESGLSAIDECSHTLRTTTRESVFIPEPLPCICIGNGQAHVTGHYTEEISQTLNCMHDPMTILEPRPIAVAQPAKYRVRRLTPLECTRLQGYPDHWVDIGDWTDSKGKRHKDADAPKYAALGNSIAMPFWKWLMRRIYNEAKKVSTEPVLGSLFDGIGGFPLCWPGETAWSSEIAEFPLAVLKARFGE